MEGYKYQEIAGELDLPIGTVKSRIFMARRQLKDQLQHHYSEPFQSRKSRVASLETI